MSLSTVRKGVSGLPCTTLLSSPKNRHKGLGFKIVRFYFKHKNKIKQTYKDKITETHR